MGAATSYPVISIELAREILGRRAHLVDPCRVVQRNGGAGLVPAGVVRLAASPVRIEAIDGHSKSAAEPETFSVRPVPITVDEGLVTAYPQIIPGRIGTEVGLTHDPGVFRGVVDANELHSARGAFGARRRPIDQAIAEGVGMTSERLHRARHRAAVGDGAVEDRAAVVDRATAVGSGTAIHTRRSIAHRGASRADQPSRARRTTLATGAVDACAATRAGRSIDQSSAAARAGGAVETRHATRPAYAWRAACARRATSS